MAILQQFGIDGTVFIHMIIFMIAIIFLSTVVFKPYLKALEMREQRTKGGEALAGEIQKQSADLRTRFEAKAKEVSTEIKTIYDKVRGQAAKDYEQIVASSGTLMNRANRAFVRKPLPSGATSTSVTTLPKFAAQASKCAIPIF